MKTPAKAGRRRARGRVVPSRATAAAMEAERGAALEEIARELPGLPAYAVWAIRREVKRWASEMARLRKGTRS